MKKSAQIATVLAVMLMGLSPTQAQFAETPSFTDFRRVDFYTPTIVSSGRVVGLGGAYIGVAEGADGIGVNPASLAVRYGHAPDEWFDWDVALSFLTLPRDASTQVDLSDLDSQVGGVQYTYFAGNLQFGRHGFGVSINGQTYALGADIDESEYQYEQVLGGLGYAYAFGAGDLTLGASVAGGDAKFVETSSTDELIKISGAGFFLGGLYAPCGERYRIGATWRTPVLAKRTDDQKADKNIETVPQELSVPWELGIGFSYMAGRRQYNVCPSYGEYDEDSPELYGKYFRRANARRYFLVSTDLVLTGASEDAIGVQAFLQEELERAGQETSVSVRAGVESEVVPNLLTVRIGGYFEPSRYDHRGGRPHATGGLDLYALDWIYQWKLTASADTAESYFNFGLGIGFWH